MVGVIEQLRSDGVFEYVRNGVPIIYGSGTDNTLTSSSIQPPLGPLSGLNSPPDVAIFVGGPGNDTILAGPGDDVIYGGSGDDTLKGSDGNNYLDGGPGTDTAVFGGKAIGTDTDTSAQIEISDGGAPPDGFDPDHESDAPFITKHGTGTDVLHSIEKIRLSNQADTVTIDANSGKALDYLQEIDAGGHPSGARDVLDLRRLGKSITFHNDKIQGYKTEFKGFEVLQVDPGNDKVILKGGDAKSWQEVDFGNGDDTIDSDVVNLKINFGNGTDILKHAGRGSVVNAGKGKDTFVISDDVLIVGAKPTDVIAGTGGRIEHGAVGRIGSEDPWIVGPDNMRYGLDVNGELAIKDTLGHVTFVANYVGGPNVSFDQQTAGIFVGLGSFHAEMLLDLKRPYNDNIPTTFKLGNQILFTQTGKKIFDQSFDPLVLDLTGSGINLTDVSSAAPMLDMNHTGFAVHSGWIEANDGVLMLDAGTDAAGKDILQMVGAQGGGFAALAQDDADGNGVIDANDPVFSQLRVWRDLNGDGVVDPGEIETLAQAGIASINVAPTTQGGGTIAGNTILGSGSFTRADGTAGNMADVSFVTDPFHSKYLGDTSVSAAATALPNLKGFGTLADLRVAMTIDPALAHAGEPGAPQTLIDVINATLPSLDVTSLDALRQAALPIFLAWARAVPLLDANGKPQVVDPTAGHSDVPILVHTDASGNQTVDDFAYRFTDTDGNTFWKLASGNAVNDAQGHVINHPTFDDVMAQPGWTDLTGAEIGFMERYLGHPMPLDATPGDPSAMLAAMQSFVTGAWSAMNLEAVRLAMQGPLASYFPGLVYDAATNKFSATTEAQLTPMYDAIFAAAPGDATGAAAWLAAWKPIIDVVLGDFDRGEGLQVTYGYQFASMVRAYESSHLALSIEDAATALGVPAGLVVEGGANFTGPDGSSIYYLHGGDQTVAAGNGLNNFVMGGTFGHDVINDDEPVLGGGDPSILRFTSVKSTDVVATRDGLDLVLDVKGTNEQVRVVGEFTGVRLGFNGTNFNDTVGVAQISFADGVLWDMPDIAWAVARPDPTHPVILGTMAMDVLDGGVGGNNYLSGGDGSDIYIFGRGYGHGTIEVNRTDPFNNATDYVQFGPGITEQDLTFSRQGNSNDLQIAINGTSDTLKIIGQFPADYGLFGPMWLDRIDGFTFADGSSLSWEDVIQTINAEAPTSTSVQIYGFDYADTLDAGANIRYLSGGNENDTYIFDFGHPFDVVQDATGNILSGMDDTIQFGDTVRPQDVTSRSLPAPTTSRSRWPTARPCW
jgi:hypothetical protein